MKITAVNELLNFDDFYREELKSRPRLARDEARREYLALSTDERQPEPSDPFEFFDDGDFPGCPQQEMLAWVPKDIQQRYGKGSFSVVSGDCLVFEASNEREIVGAFEDKRIPMCPR